MIVFKVYWYITIISTIFLFFSREGAGVGGEGGGRGGDFLLLSLFLGPFENGVNSYKEEFEQILSCKR